MSSSVSSARGQLLSLGEAAEGVDVCIRSLRALGVRCGVGNGSTDAIAMTAAELWAKNFGLDFQTNISARPAHPRVLARPPQNGIMSAGWQQAKPRRSRPSGPRQPEAASVQL